MNGSEELGDLYQQMILDHNKNPRNFHELDEQTHQAEGFNPLCGDHYHIYAKVNAQGIIEDVAFKGTGCAISKASASMMTQAVIGKTEADARRLFRQFHDLVTGKCSVDQIASELGKLAVFSGVCRFPSRIKCAALCWHTLQGALDRDQDAVSTE
jgi:nitrogen fixation NifU-like protein